MNEIIDLMKLVPGEVPHAHDRDLLWKTADGRYITIGLMDDEHLENCIRFLIRTTKQRRDYARKMVEKLGEIPMDLEVLDVIDIIKMSEMTTAQLLPPTWKHMVLEAHTRGLDLSWLRDYLEERL